MVTATDHVINTPIDALHSCGMWYLFVVLECMQCGIGMYTLWYWNGYSVVLEWIQCGIGMDTVWWYQEFLILYSLRAKLCMDFMVM